MIAVALLGPGASAAWAEAVTLPMADGSYVNWNDATTLQNCKIENDGANVGSTRSNTVVTFNVTNTVQQDYILQFATGAKDEATLQVTMAGSAGNVLDVSTTVVDTDSWDPTTQHAFLVSNLPVGDYTLTFKVTNVTGSYAGNWGKLAFTLTDGFDSAPGSITLQNGTYANGLRYEDGGNVGYVKNGGSAAYNFICREAGVYSLNMEMARHDGGTMGITVTDAATGKVEVNTQFAIDESVPGSYTPQSIALPGEISEGLKTLTLSFESPTDGYIVNYQNVSLEKQASLLASITGLTVAGQTVAEGDETDWQCNLPINYDAETVTFTVASQNCQLTVTAANEAGEPITVTTGEGGSYSVPVPQPNEATTVTMAIAPNDGAAAPQTAYTLRLFRLGGIMVSALTVDGEELPAELIDALNAEGNTATLTGRIYTALPAVQAKMNDGTLIDATGRLDGTQATYSLSATQGDLTRSYTLTIDGIHIYNKQETDETVQLKYTSAGKTGDGTWSNGLYTLTCESLDGWDNIGFKFNSEAHTWTIPADVVVKQVVLKEFNSNYGPGELVSLVAGDATVYIPYKHDYQEPDATKYDLVINIEGHKAGTPITFTLQGGGQPNCWFEFTVEKQHITSAPVPVSVTATPTTDRNHCVVAVAYDRKMMDTEATVGGQTVTAKGGSSVLYFPVWDLEYDTDYTFTIAAGAAKDIYGNANAELVSLDIKVGSKAVADKKAYDYVVGTAQEFTEAVAAVNAVNTSADAPRKTIFIKNGDYDFGSAEQKLTAYNVSLIGESRDEVVLHGLRDGISNPVLNLRDRSGFYLQDLTVRNDYDYGADKLNGVAVAIYGGNKTAMRNVRMLSNQDTQVTGERAYFEECAIHGTVDFICGGGTNYYYKTDLVLENRGGNCITAPATGAGLDFGYVFDQCTIKRMEGAGEVVDGSYNLGRPWQNEPRAAFINTTMEVLPTAEGWTSMAELPTHFYEFGSVDGAGEPVNLSGRKNSPTSTNTYNPVLTAEEAAAYNLRNVLGGTDSWLPTEETAVSGAPTVTLRGSTLSWADLDDARCYVIFRDGQYLDNVTATSYNVTEQGTYTVRSANRNGGLGGSSLPVRYATEVTTGVEGWATACLSYDAEVPEGTKAYCISAIEDNQVVLNELDEIPAGEGFILNAAEGPHTFAALKAAPSPISNLLVGTLSAVAVEPNSVYVLGKREEAGEMAMMLYTGTEIGAGHAYLPMPTGETVAAYTFKLGTVDGITSIDADGGAPATVYNLSGQRVESMQKGRIYIVNGKKVMVK